MSTPMVGTGFCFLYSFHSEDLILLMHGSNTMDMSRIILDMVELLACGLQVGKVNVVLEEKHY